MGKSEKNELDYRMLMEQSADGIFISDAQGNYTDVNHAACDMMGYSREELVGLHITDIIAEDEIPRLADEVGKFSGGKIVNSEWLFKRKDGSLFPGDLIGRSLPDGRLQGILRDVTEQKMAHEKIMKANRLYAFISGINQSIVHIKEQQELFDRVCNIAIEVGQFKMAWIGMVDESGLLNMISLRGDETATQEVQKYSGIDYSSSALCNTPTGKVIRTGHYAVSNDLQNDPAMSFWRDEYIQHGIHASISMPIIRSGEVTGIFSLQAGSKGFFDESEITLLKEAAIDISFALENFKKEKLRHAAEKKLTQNEERLHQAQSLAHVGSWEIDIPTGVSVWSDQNCRIFGLSIEDNKHSPEAFLTFIHQDDLQYVKDIIQASKVSPQSSSFYTRIIRKDGMERYVNIERRYELDEHGRAKRIYGICHDITEQKLSEQKILKANRLYAFISNISQSIVHFNEEKYLFDKACDIAVAIGGFKMAWIGIINEQNGALKMVSQRGTQKVIRDLKPYVEIDFSIDVLKDSVTGRALRTGQYAVSNDTQNDPGMNFWNEYQIQNNIRATISFPLKKFGKTVGIFAFHSETLNFFDEQEIRLLKGAAVDISFALELFEKEKLRKEVEDKLRHNEAQLKEAQAIAKMGSWELDMTNNIVIWSDEQFHLLGFMPGEVKPSNELFFGMIHPDDAAKVNSDFGKTMQIAVNSSARFRLVRRDGTVITLQCEWKFEFDDDQKPKRIYGILQDLTEQIRYEDQQKLFASIVNSSDDAIASKAMDGIITSWNYGAEKILGYSASEVIGRNISMLVPPHLLGEDKMILEKIYMGGSMDHYETQRVKKDGEIIDVSLTVSPIRDAMGHIVGASKILRDVTERNKAESEIRELSEKQIATNHQLSTILDTLPANIALLDENGTIIAVDEAWKKFAVDNDMKGRQYGVGDNYLAVCENAIGVDSDGAGDMAVGIRQVLQGVLDEFALEYPCHSPIEARWFRVEVRPLEGKKNSGAVVMHVNITERKLAENEIKSLNENLEKRVQSRTAELSEANKALETFSYSVSHDLRAPIRTMMGFSKIIQQEYSASLDPEAKELFGFIEDNGKRANTIIDDLLKLARYDRVILRQEPVEMKQLVESIWSNINLTSPHRAALQLSELPMVRADRSMMEQVLINLLSNAIKYSSKKAKPLVSMWSESGSGVDTFYIKDNGAGFDMGHYDKLFGAFQRLHGMSDFEGTGVGLTLVKQIIEKHGGTVGAVAKVDEGATFYFTLPVDRKG